MKHKQDIIVQNLLSRKCTKRLHGDFYDRRGVDMFGKQSRKVNRQHQGFTLAELLIVVAIIAVLVAISIPIFTTQLEKSREATDLANVRSAYAEVMAAAMTGDATATYNGQTIKKGELYSVEVDLKQKPGWTMDKTQLNIADCTYANGGMIEDPGSVCEIRYNPNPAEGKNSLIFDWDGGSYRYREMGSTDFKTWGPNGAQNTTDVSGKRISTSNLIKLDPKKTYTVTFKLPDDYDGEYQVQMGTQLYWNEGTTQKNKDSGWLTNAKYTGTNDNRTVTYQIDTANEYTNFGANFRILDKNNNEIDLKNNPEAYNFLTSVVKTLVVKKKR